MTLCVSVSASVTSRYCIEIAERIERFGIAAASFNLSFNTVLQRNSSKPKNVTQTLRVKNFATAWLTSERVANL